MAAVAAEAVATSAVGKGTFTLKLIVSEAPVFPATSLA
jgi:hypothetical protein